MWEPPQRGDRGRKRVSSFQDSTLTQENDGLTPIAIDCRPFGTYSLIGSGLSKFGHFQEKVLLVRFVGLKGRGLAEFARTQQERVKRPHGFFGILANAATRKTAQSEIIIALLFRCNREDIKVDCRILLRDIDRRDGFVGIGIFPCPGTERDERAVLSMSLPCNIAIARA